MPVKATNWTPTTLESTNWTGRNNESLAKGSPFGLLLAITQGQSVDSLPAVATDYTNVAINATGWGSNEVFIDEIGLQNGDTLVLQTGDSLLIP